MHMLTSCDDMTVWYGVTWFLTVPAAAAPGGRDGNDYNPQAVATSKCCQSKEKNVSGLGRFFVLTSKTSVGFGRFPEFS